MEQETTLYIIIKSAFAKLSSDDLIINIYLALIFYSRMIGTQKRSQSIPWITKMNDKNGIKSKVSFAF